MFLKKRNKSLELNHLNLVSAITSLWTINHEQGLTKRTDIFFSFYQKKERRDGWPSLWHYTRDTLGQDNQRKIITILRDARFLFVLSQFVPCSLANDYSVHVQTVAAKGLWQSQCDDTDNCTHDLKTFLVYQTKSKMVDWSPENEVFFSPFHVISHSQ